MLQNGSGPTASEKHELVYANLDFDQNQTEITNLKSNGDSSSVATNGTSQHKNGGNSSKPIPRAKPKAAKRNSPSKLPQQQLKQQSQLNKGRIANSTEYAQIAFSDKTDL